MAATVKARALFDNVDSGGGGGRLVPQADAAASGAESGHVRRLRGIDPDHAPVGGPGGRRQRARPPRGSIFWVFGWWLVVHGALRQLRGGDGLRGRGKGSGRVAAEGPGGTCRRKRLARPQRSADFQIVPGERRCAKGQPRGWSRRGEVSFRWTAPVVEGVASVNEAAINRRERARSSGRAAATAARSPAVPRCCRTGSSSR